MKRHLLLAGAILFLGGCADEKFVGRPGLTLTSGDALPPPTPADVVTPARDYLIGPYDKLDISVFGIPELSRALQVDAAGGISLPLVGLVSASGKSPTELSAEIANRLRSNVRNPQVSVNVTEALSQVYTVGGDVQSPGLYPVVGRMTLIRAIARGGGTTEFSRENYVLVYRTVKGQDLVALYDLRSIRQGIYADPAIFADDVILVGDSRARHVFHDFLQASGLLAAPLIALANKS